MNIKSRSKFARIFELMLNIRDSQLVKGAQRSLLIALALRCDPDKNYLAWPSYGLLADDTMLDAATLKRAAKRLEELKLISRRVRANKSNRFYVNAGLIAATAQERRLAKTQNVEVDDCPFRAEPAIHAVANVDDGGEIDAIIGGGR